MKTVENDRIRVTVTDEIWDNALNSAKYQHVNQTREQIARALVLSRGMSILGNKSETILLENETEIDHSEIMEYANDMIIFEWLNENTRYKSGETYMRYKIGARMSTGMEMEISQACAYARGILEPINTEDYYNKLEDIFRSDKPQNIKYRLVRVEKLKLGNSKYAEASEYIERAVKSIQEHRKCELNYRKMKSNSSGYEIEIIGDMPEQIGLCRYKG